MALDLTPSPAAARPGRLVSTQLRNELRLNLRNGEQLLLTLIIPVLVLVVGHAAGIGDGTADYLVPGVIALAVMSTAFTGQAIATGFERRYGVLKRLGATPLGRGSLLLAKTLGVVCTEVLQLAVISAVGLALGWHPHGNGLVVVLLVVLGTAAFSGLGLLMAGTLKAEVTLAAANAVYVVLLLAGGLVFALDGWLHDVGRRLPSGALATALRAVLQHGASPQAGDVVTLLVWTVVGTALAARLFRWE